MSASTASSPRRSVSSSPNSPETQATSLQSEVSAGGWGHHAVREAEAGSKVQAGENHSSQVLRKAVIRAPSSSSTKSRASLELSGSGPRELLPRQSMTSRAFGDWRRSKGPLGCSAQRI
jgi:hypothetical protein